MARGPRLRLGQLVLFAVVVVLLNFQFTWWVVNSLRENRKVLELERELARATAENVALEMAQHLEKAVQRLVTVPYGVIPAATEEFPVLEVVPQRASGFEWQRSGSALALVWPLSRQRSVVAQLDMAALSRWLASTHPAYRLVRATDGGGAPGQAALPEPLLGWAVVGEEEGWQQVLAAYRQRVVAVVGGAVFFFAAIGVAVGVLWSVLRREGMRELQHQNFVSGITHELKTPIAGIRLAIETVLSGRVDAAGSRQFLSNALADADRLADLVTKVLEVTRFAGGAHRLQLAPNDLSQLVEEELAAAERHAKVRGVVLESAIEPFIQAPFDPEALAIVISNLLENALKYAQGNPPRVWVRLRVVRGEAILEVEDTGVGISPEELEAIFEPFYRSSDEVTRRTPGTGIGLFVAREIVAAHRGRLVAWSRGRGLGAVFRMVLPGASVVSEDELSE
jgi:signal transduction histidine kinase